MKRLVFALLLIVAASVVGAVCNWASSAFEGSGSCTDSPCGAGCTIVAYGPDHYACYTSMDSCCRCHWYYYDCQCTFGAGWGRHADRFQTDGYSCQNDTFRTCVYDPQ